MPGALPKHLPEGQVSGAKQILRSHPEHSLMEDPCAPPKALWGGGASVRQPKKLTEQRESVFILLTGTQSHFTAIQNPFAICLASSPSDHQLSNTENTDVRSCADPPKYCIKSMKQHLRHSSKSSEHRSVGTKESVCETRLAEPRCK